jgi:hypothetical protein
MLTPEEEVYIREKAYIPEHIVGLMQGISGGEPFLVEGCLCFRREDWVILVGYPLDRDTESLQLKTLKEKVISRFHPRLLSLMATEIPAQLHNRDQKPERDFYYTLALDEICTTGSVRRNIKKARLSVNVERTREVRDEHNALTQEFLVRADPPERVKNLFQRMARYVSGSKDALVLNARDREGHLSAYYIVDLGAKDFSTYVTGCHSKKAYILGASDVLFLEMVELSREHKKRYIHLGLGVNEGIRRFKEKWGGMPTIPYEMCEIPLKRASLLDHLAVFQQIRGIR